MGIKTVQDTSLTSVANAIRVKAEISGTLEFPDEFVSAIQNISTGITPSGTKTITENGTYDVTNFASADVNVSGGGGEIHFESIPLARDSSTQLSGRLKGNPKMLVIYCDGDFRVVSSSTSIYLETFIDVPNYASLKYVRCYNRKTGACGSLSSIAPSATISWTFANNIITVTTNGLYFPSETTGFYKILYAY